MIHVTIWSQGCQCCTHPNNTALCVKTEEDLQSEIFKRFKYAIEEYAHYKFGARQSNTKFCPNCGELVTDEHVYSAKSIVREFDHKYSNGEL